VRALLQRHGIPRHRQAPLLAEILGVPYRQAHRKLGGQVSWSLEEQQTVARRFGETLADVVDAVAASDAEAATLIVDDLRLPCRFWRGAALAGGLATVAVAVVGLNLSREVGRRESALAQASQQKNQLAQQNVQLAAQLQSKPEIQYVAVLADDKASASILVTFDPKQNRLTLKRVGNYQESPDKSLELWALPRTLPDGSAAGGPRSLGVMDGGAVVKLTAAENQVKEAPALAVTLEPKGGVPPGSGPTGPVLFKGALLQTAI
jgi:anti-sigma-K factor RskA